MNKDEKNMLFSFHFIPILCFTGKALLTRERKKVVTKFLG